MHWVIRLFGRHSGVSLPFARQLRGERQTTWPSCRTSAFARWRRARSSRGVTGFALSTEEFDVTAYLHLGIPHPAIPTGPPAPLVCPCGVNSGPRSCSASNGEVDAYMDTLPPPWGVCELRRTTRGTSTKPHKTLLSKRHQETAG